MKQVTFQINKIEQIEQKQIEQKQIEQTEISNLFFDKKTIKPLKVVENVYYLNK
jgi:hypothetical protein